MKRMDTLLILGISAGICVWITSYVVIAFLAYSQGQSEAYRRGLDDGIRIIKNIKPQTFESPTLQRFGVPAEKLGGGRGI